MRVYPYIWLVDGLYADIVCLIVSCTREEASRSPSVTFVHRSIRTLSMSNVYVKSLKTGRIFIPPNKSSHWT
uniref:Putative secreted protein n=1 Tax=Ixodes ricinus TaxID=34613 RepID=A0A6B0U0V8_IXORI